MPAIPPPADLRFDACAVRFAERQLLIDGKPARLGARAFDLLVALIERRDRTVGKDELLQVVWPGMVVEENNLQVHVSALRKLLGPQAITTVPGRGYRFTASVTEQGPAGRAGGADAGPAQAPAGAGGAGAPLAVPDRPSIAVLPFDNLGNDPEQAWFIDGVTEDIITELSRFRSLFVVARNSSFSYRGRAVDLRTIAAELGVRYVVEGSIRRIGNRVRVTAQLVDGLTGAHLWAERYDRALEDMFEVQESLTRAIVTAVAPQIEAVEFEKARSVRSGNLHAYQLAMRARDAARRADKEADGASHDEALRLAEEAVAIDPGCCTALDALAYLHWRQVWAGTSVSNSAAVEKGLAAARRAISIDSGDHAAHLWKGMLLLYSGQPLIGLADLRRAHELNPNDALTLSLLGQYEAAAGNAAAGIAHATDALRLSPLDSLRWSFFNSLAWAHFSAGDYRQAIDAAQRSIGEAPRFYPPRLCLAISQAGLGEIDQAKADFAPLRELAPAAVDERLAGRWGHSNPALAALKTRLLRVAAGVHPAPQGIPAGTDQPRR